MPKYFVEYTLNQIIYLNGLNRLSLNINKTKYIIFIPKSKCRQQQLNSFTTQIGGKTIECVKHLGLR